MLPRVLFIDLYISGLKFIFIEFDGLTVDFFVLKTVTAPKFWLRQLIIFILFSQLYHVCRKAPADYALFAHKFSARRLFRQDFQAKSSEYR